LIEDVEKIFLLVSKNFIFWVKRKEKKRFIVKERAKTLKASLKESVKYNKIIIKSWKNKISIMMFLVTGGSSERVVDVTCF